MSHKKEFRWSDKQHAREGLCVSSSMALQKRLNDMTQRIADRDRQRLYNPDDFENPTAARIEDALTTLEDAEQCERSWNPTERKDFSHDDDD